MKELIEKITENKIIFWVCFGLLIAAALALRLSVIEFPLWYDEGCSIAAAVKSFPHGINDYLWNYDYQHTPLYFYILYFIMKFFGDSEFVMRFSSVIVSIIHLPLIYVVTSKLSSKKIGLAAMLLMSVNTFQVLYSIEIRMYPYVILLALLSVNYLIDYDRKGDIPSLVKLGIVNVLNPYFLTGSIVFVLAQFIIYSSYLDVKKAEKEKISRYMFSNFIVLLCFIPYFILIGHYALVRSGFLVTDLTKFEMNNFWGLLQNIFAADAGHIHETRHEAFKFDFYTVSLVFLPLVMMFWGLVNTLKDKEKLNTVVLGIVTLCFVIFVFAANSKTIAFTGRYLIFVTPLIFVLTAIGWSKFNKYVFGALLVLYSALCLYGLSKTYEQYRRIAYYSLKAPAEYVKTKFPEKHNLVIMPFASSVSFYYFKDAPRVMPLELFHEVRNPDNKMFYDEWQRKAFKTEDKYRVFQRIILDGGFISQNFKSYLQSELDKVPSGAYIIWIIYYSDNYALQKEEVVKRYYSNYENVREHAMTGILSKFDLDLIKLLLPQADFIVRERDDSNSYLVFKKR